MSALVCSISLMLTKPLDIAVDLKMGDIALFDSLHVLVLLLPMSTTAVTTQLIALDSTLLQLLNCQSPSQSCVHALRALLQTTQLAVST